MNSKVAPFFLSLLILTACSKNALITTSESFSENELAACKTVNCPEIRVDYITVSGDEVIAASINAEINDFIINSLYIGDQNQSPIASTIDAAAEGFIKNYRMDSADFPDMAAEYFAEVSVTENFSSENLLSLGMGVYLFTGGAHGYGALSYKNYDPQTGNLWTYETLFKDPAGFTAFAEKAFRKKYKIPEGASINTPGFWFEDDQFYLPEGLGFTKSKLLIYYNQYEIAPYSEGPIELEIPLKDVLPFLSVAIQQD